MKCVKCQQEKDNHLFDFRKDTKKYDTRCKDCRRTMNRERYKIKPAILLKTRTCSCGESFLLYPIINGKRQKNQNRKHCYTCSPFGARRNAFFEGQKQDKTGFRVCSCCNKSKELNDKNYTLNRPKRVCRKCESDRTIERQKAQKIKWIEYKGGRCQRCGYKKCVRSLHFHHADPTKKDFTLGKYRSRSWALLKKELDKCILVCANCHGEIHDDLMAKN